MVRTERDVAQRFSEPGRQIYIGLGECAKGEAGLIFNQAVARASSEPSQQVVFASEPFGADVSPRPPLCALLKTASMSPVAKHYRSRLLRLRQVR